jgi:hypothetical protein
MKAQRTLRLALFVALALFFGNILNVTVSTSRFNESYPPVVCAPSLSGLSTAISLTSPKTTVRKTGTSSIQSREIGIRRFSVASEAAIIGAGVVTPVVWQVRTGTWAGAVACSAPVTSQWFVGAAADVTSRGSLSIVNSGLGKAMVDVVVYNESGQQSSRTVSIRANAYTKIALSVLAPGSRAIAINVIPRSGRINAFLLDERGRGLQALGGDLVNSTSEPTQRLQIPAIPQVAGNRGTASHVLRLLVPGEVDARITAEIRSTDGTFSPVGIDGRVVAHGRVIEIPMDINTDAPRFALVIGSDQPILGSVFSKTLSQGKRDFIWSTAAQDLKPFTLATTGLSPQLVFTGKEIKVDLEITSMSGKSKKIEIKATDIATYQVPDSTRSVTFKKISQETSGAALITSKSGYGYIPLTPGSELTKSSIPASNIRVLNP